MTDSPILESREIEQDIRANERQKVLAEIEGWLVELSTMNYQQIEDTFGNEPEKVVQAIAAELRAKLAEMKGGK